MIQIDMRLGDTQAIIEEATAQKATTAQIAYILATAYWETARTMKPVREGLKASDKWRKANLRYYPWYGRGYVQLTWEKNYIKAAHELGVPSLASDADKALDPVIARKVLVRGCLEGWFTRQALGKFVNADSCDFVKARKVVNGTDKAAEIASIAQAYLEALEEALKQKALEAEEAFERAAIEEAASGQIAALRLAHFEALKQSALEVASLKRFLRISVALTLIMTLAAVVF